VKQTLRARAPDAVNISEADFSPFFGGRSTPAIRAMVVFILAAAYVRIRADDAHHAFAVDQLALVADFLYRRSNFHSLFLIAQTDPSAFALTQSSSQSVPRQVVLTQLDFHAVAGRSRTQFRTADPAPCARTCALLFSSSR